MRFDDNETQASETKCTEVCWTNYTRCVVPWSNERSAVRSASRIIPRAKLSRVMFDSYLVQAPNKGITNFSPWIQALGFVFHNVVERPVDNNVDNLLKCVIDAILHQIA